MKSIRDILRPAALAELNRDGRRHRLARIWREYHGLTNEEAAAICGVEPYSFSRFGTHRQRPEAGRLVAKGIGLDSSTRPWKAAVAGTILA